MKTVRNRILLSSLRRDSWHLSRGVLWVAQADVVIIVSLKRNRYYTLDGVGAHIWRSICEGGSVETTTARLRDSVDGDVDAGTIGADVEELVLEFARWRLIERSPEPGERDSHGVQHVHRRAEWLKTGRLRATRNPRLIVCMAMLAVVHVLLPVLGLRRLTAMIYRAGPPKSECAPEDWLRGIASKVSTAAMLLPFRSFCLPQSLCLAWALRLAGVDAKLRLGAQAYPFRAHAWVDVNGFPVNEFPEYLEIFHPFPPLEPGLI